MLWIWFLVYYIFFEQIRDTQWNTEASMRLLGDWLCYQTLIQAAALLITECTQVFRGSSLTACQRGFSQGRMNLLLARWAHFRTTSQYDYTKMLLYRHTKTAASLCFADLWALLSTWISRCFPSLCLQTSEKSLVLELFSQQIILFLNTPHCNLKNQMSHVFIRSTVRRDLRKWINLIMKSKCCLLKITSLQNGGWWGGEGGELSLELSYFTLSSLIYRKNTTNLLFLQHKGFIQVNTLRILPVMFAQLDHKESLWAKGSGDIAWPQRALLSSHVHLP